MTYIVTTSHRPSRRTRSFAKDFSRILPGGVRINRGKKTLRDLFYDALELKAKRIVIIGERKGNPGLMRFYVPGERGLIGISEFRVSGVSLAGEVGGCLPENPRSIGLLLERSIGVGEEVLDLIVESLAARLILQGEKADIYVAAIPRGRIIKLVFLDGEGRICGPIIRVASVRRCVGLASE